MEMCGHATVGAIWLLNEMGKLPSSEVQISTKSGIVDAKVLRTVNREEGGGETNSNSLIRVFLFHSLGV